MSDAPVDAAGFRLRGLQMTRIETFTDAAFAFALTLLVISLDPPRDLVGMRAALTQVPAFLLSAGMLMMFWWAHHQWSRRYGLDDYRTFLLSCALVFTVLVYVYPLRFMFSLMMGWIGGNLGLPLGGGLAIRGPEDVNEIFAIYGIGFCAMSASVLLLYVHAWRERGPLLLDAVELHATHAAIGAWSIVTATGAASVTVALLAPPELAGMPGWVYMPLAVVMPLYGWWTSRRTPTREPRPAAQLLEH